MHFVYLCSFAFAAGLVDSIVGGGGLIQLPAMLIYLPGAATLPIGLVFGTNKLAAVCGTAMSSVQYARRVPIRWHSILPAGIAAFIFSFLGARVVSSLDPQKLKPVIWGLLVAVAVWTYRRKDFGNLHAPKFLAHHERLAGVGVGMVLGFYDGFFGPGTGSFLIFIFIGMFGFDFLAASASAKAINVATNLSAVIYFAATDQILYRYALLMGACNMLGSLVGTRLAIWKGNQFVRGMFLVMVSVMIARFGWQIFFES